MYGEVLVVIVRAVVRVGRVVLVLNFVCCYCYGYPLVGRFMFLAVRDNLGKISLGS